MTPPEVHLQTLSAFDGDGRIVETRERRGRVRSDSYARAWAGGLRVCGSAVALPQILKQLREPAQQIADPIDVLTCRGRPRPDLLILGATSEPAMTGNWANEHPEHIQKHRQDDTSY